MENALNPPHTLCIPSLGSEKGKKPLKKIPKFLWPSPPALWESPGPWTRKMDQAIAAPARCHMLTSIKYIQLYQDDHLWKDSLKYAVAVVVQLMAPLLPLPLHLHRGQHTAWGEQSYIFCLFLRQGHQQALWGEQNDVLSLTTILIGTLLISKVIEAQHLSKNI